MAHASAVVMMIAAGACSSSSTSEPTLSPSAPPPSAKSASASDPVGATEVASTVPASAVASAAGLHMSDNTCEWLTDMLVVEAGLTLAHRGDQYDPCTVYVAEGRGLGFTMRVETATEVGQYRAGTCTDPVGFFESQSKLDPTSGLAVSADVFEGRPVMHESSNGMPAALSWMCVNSQWLVSVAADHSLEGDGGAPDENLALTDALAAAFVRNHSGQ